MTHSLQKFHKRASTIYLPPYASSRNEMAAPDIIQARTYGGTMSQRVYTIAHSANGWTISVQGVEQISVPTLEEAVKVAVGAAHSLPREEPQEANQLKAKSE
jgi:hypothetical protein